jgi:hypothetical protein
MILEKQTQEIGKHYLYVHIRLDNNSPFYVGIGTKYSYSQKDYQRAKESGKKRNYIWRGIVNRTDYKIIILFENNDYNFIKQKEIELISQYGQIIKNTGTLCNISDGGDGLRGFRNPKTMKPVFLYLNTGEFYKEFECYADCAKFLKVVNSSVRNFVNKNCLIKGFIIKNYKTDNINQIIPVEKNVYEKLRKKLSKKIYQYDLNDKLIKCWNSSVEAGKTLNINCGHIRECASNPKRRTMVKGFKWKYF